MVWHAVRYLLALAAQIRANRFQLLGIDLTFQAVRLAVPVPTGISSIIERHPTGWLAWFVGFVGTHANTPVRSSYYDSWVNGR